MIFTELRKPMRSETDKDSSLPKKRKIPFETMTTENKRYKYTDLNEVRKVVVFDPLKTHRFCINQVYLTEKFRKRLREVPMITKEMWSVYRLLGECLSHFRLFEIYELVKTHRTLKDTEEVDYDMANFSELQFTETQLEDAKEAITMEALEDMLENFNIYYRAFESNELVCHECGCPETYAFGDEYEDYMSSRDSGYVKGSGCPSCHCFKCGFRYVNLSDDDHDCD
jgi:hypothetical protein